MRMNFLAEKLIWLIGNFGCQSRWWYLASQKDIRQKNNMIQLLRSRFIYYDNGSYCGDGCCWNTRWESEEFPAGEEIDEDDPKYNISDLTEGEDFVRL